MQGKGGSHRLDGRASWRTWEAEELTGTTVKEARGCHLNDLLRIDQGSGERLPGFVGGAVGRMEVFGWSMGQANGKSLPVDLNIAPVEDCDGKRTGMVVTIRNATERLRCEAITEAEEDQTPFNRAQTGMVHMDAYGRITRVNVRLFSISFRAFAPIRFWAAH